MQRVLSSSPGWLAGPGAGEHVQEPGFGEVACRPAELERGGQPKLGGGEFAQHLAELEARRVPAQLRGAEAAWPSQLPMQRCPRLLLAVSHRKPEE